MKKNDVYYINKSDKYEYNGIEYSSGLNIPFKTDLVVYKNIFNIKYKYIGLVDKNLSKFFGIHFKKTII
jgi:hypothetical protein